MIRKWIVLKLLWICSCLYPELDVDVFKNDGEDPENIIFLNSFKDDTYLKLKEFMLAYESCDVDCIAAVIKYKRTEQQKEDGTGSIVDFLSDWSDDNSSATIGIIKRLLTQTETEAYGYPEEDE